MEIVAPVAPASHDRTSLPEKHDHLQPCEEPPTHSSSRLGHFPYSSDAETGYRPGLLEVAAKVHGHGLEPLAQSLVDLRNGHLLAGVGGLALGMVGMRAPGARAITKQLIAGTKEYGEFVAAHGDLMKHVNGLLSPNPGALTFSLPQWAATFKSYLELALYDVQHGSLKQMQSVLQEALHTLRDHGAADLNTKLELTKLIQSLGGKGETVVKAAAGAIAKPSAR